MTPRCWQGEAPGRLDVLGGVADYSGALVLQMPIRTTTRVTITPRVAAGLELLSASEGRVTVPLPEAAVLRGPDEGSAENAPTRIHLGASGPQQDAQIALGYFGREDRSRKRFDANSPRRVGPPRAGHFGLRAYVEVTDAGWRNNGVPRDVSLRSAPGPSVCMLTLTGSLPAIPNSATTTTPPPTGPKPRCRASAAQTFKDWILAGLDVSEAAE